MKFKILFGFILLMIGFYGVSVYLGTKAPSRNVTTPESANKEVEAEASTPAPLKITVDKTVIDEVKSVVVTSYADSLDLIRPAVVSVYSTKIIRGRTDGIPFNDPFLRRFFGPQSPQPKEQIQKGLGSGVIVSADGIYFDK